VIEVLKLGGMKIPDEAVIRGIEAARWDGRMEIVSRKPYIVLDGAQNRASAEVLAGAVKKIFNYNRLILVFGASKDKDIKGILEELIPITDSVVLTKSEVVNRALEPAKIKEALAEIRSDMGATVTSGVKAALDVARANASPDDLILVTGSLFVVGEAISVLRRGTDGQA
jgi:folylpolyglutamate synthase/dihydropteroate synthase